MLLKKVITSDVSDDLATLGRLPITRDQMLFLQEVDPLLDVGWNEKVSESFMKLDLEQRKSIYNQLLKPKNIVIDKDTKKFVCLPPKTLEVVKANLVDKGLRITAEKLVLAKNELRVFSDAYRFADLLESSLELIESYDCHEQILVQKEKTLLYRTFLGDIVLVVRSSEFNVTGNQRLLDADAIKSYIIQVFLRQKMMGYRFRLLSPRKILEDKNQFIRMLGAEAKIRKCDIVRTDDYLFLIGPANNSLKNIFSIRRFLHEDSVMQGKVIYFNVVAVPLNNIDSQDQRDHASWTLSRVVTLERQISPGILRLISEVDESYQKRLSTRLLKFIAADGSELEEKIEGLLLKYEKDVSIFILGKLSSGLATLATTRDDFEHLFSHTKSILVELISDLRDFNAQTVVAWSRKAVELELKMVSFLALLDKRKEWVFTSESHKLSVDTRDPRLLSKDLMKVVERAAADLDVLSVDLNDALHKEQQRQVESSFRKFINRVLGIDKKIVTPEMVQLDIDSVKKFCLLGIIRTFKRYPDISLYLEFEDLVALDETKRHYTFPVGMPGVSRLPVILNLSEDSMLLDTDEIQSMLGFDVITAVKEWDEAGVAS